MQRGLWRIAPLGMILCLGATGGCAGSQPEPEAPEVAADPAEPQETAVGDAPTGGVGGDAADAAAEGNEDCKAKQRQCTDNCKAQAPDKASRQPCFNQCLKEADRCKQQ